MYGNTIYADENGLLAAQLDWIE